MKKILVVNVNWIGDVIFSTPIFRALKVQYPQAAISCLCVPRVKEILESCPFVDEIIVYDEKGKHKYFLGKIKIILALWKRKFDIAFLLHRSWTRAFLIFCAGIPSRVGYDTKNRGKFLTSRIELPGQNIHRSDFYLNVIETFGVPVGDRYTELAVSPQEKKETDQILWNENISPEDKMVVVHIGGNWDLKRWPQDNFAKLIRRIEEELHFKIVIPGTLKDARVADEIKESTGMEGTVLAGKTNLKQLIALMKRADLVVSSDSGPLHIASSVGTNVIGLFGPTRPEITGPRGRGKSILLQKEIHCNQEPCYQLDCKDNICMKAVGVDEVFEKVKEILSG